VAVSQFPSERLICWCCPEAPIWQDFVGSHPNATQVSSMLKRVSGQMLYCWTVSSSRLNQASTAPLFAAPPQTVVKEVDQYLARWSRCQCKKLSVQFLLTSMVHSGALSWTISGTHSKSHFLVSGKPCCAASSRYLTSTSSSSAVRSPCLAQDSNFVGLPLIVPWSVE